MNPTQARAESRRSPSTSRRIRTRGSQAIVVFATSLAVVAAACSGDGSGTASFGPPPGFTIETVEPASFWWTGPDVEPSVRFTRELAGDSVLPDALRLRHAAGQPVSGRVRVAGATVSFVPAQPLALGDYILTFSLDVRASDGTPLQGIALAPVEFSVRPPASTWSPPLPLGETGEDDVGPLLATDAIGGASVAWIHAGVLHVAEYDRDRGWQSASPVDQPGTSAPSSLLLARGAGTAAVATVRGTPGDGDVDLIRVQVSRSFDGGGRRVWTGAFAFSADLVSDPQLHVTAAGEAFLLAASARRQQRELRVHWADARRITREDTIGFPAERFTIDQVTTGARGDVLVAWTQGDGAAVGSLARVHRQAGWEEIVQLPGPASRSGIEADGNAWLLVPELPSRAFYLIQDGGGWSAARPVVPAGLDVQVSRDRDLLVLDWRADGAGERLVAARFDRFGRPLVETVLAGPTPEPIRQVVLGGHVDAGLLAVWREGQALRFARGGDGGRSWSQAESWKRSFAPVHVERARVDHAGPRTWFTWVEGDRLVATSWTPLQAAPRPAVNVRPSADPVPLASEWFCGTATGRLLVLWREDGALHAQDLRD